MTFQPGQSGNLLGKPKGSIGFVDRAKSMLFERDIDEVIQLVNDKKRFGKLKAIDGMILKRAAEALADDGNTSMNSLLDRVLGKPSQPIEQNTTVNVNIVITEQRASALQEAQAALVMIGGGAIQSVVDNQITDAVIIEQVVDNEEQK